MTLMPATESGEIVALTASTSPTTGPGRTITGMIVEWDTVGNTSAGPTIFVAGSIALPADLNRVKLLLDHDHSQPVGYMVAAEQLPTGIRGTFAVPEGAAGDLALQQARDKLRDGMSVGAQIVDYSFDQAERLVVNASDLNETSLVAVPAFRGSLVSEVSASRKEKIVSRKTLLSIAASAAATGDTPAREPETAETSTTVEETTTTTTTEPAPAPQPAPPTDVEAARSARQAVEQAPVPASPRRDLSLTAMVGLIYRTLTADGSAARVNHVLTAALSDVTPNNISTTDYGPKRPQWVTDLYQAADVARPLMDALGPRELTALKMSGPVWDVRPQVLRYAGNKAEIPSGPVSKRRLDATAQRFAGGWDVDRVFVDLPSGGDEIEDILVEAMKSYLVETEDYVREQVTAGQTLLYGSAVTVPAALATIGSYFSRIRGSRIGIVRLGSEAFEAFANMTEAEVPWWLKDAGSLSWTTSSATVGGMVFEADDSLGATEVSAVDKRAVRVWERRPPVTVRAIDVAKGGIDVGVFGYAAVLVSDGRLVVNLDTAGRAEPV